MIDVVKSLTPIDKKNRARYETIADWMRTRPESNAKTMQLDIIFKILILKESTKILLISCY